MKPIRFLHTADWHLGASQHPDIYSNYMLLKLSDLAEEHKISHVIIAGDLFDRSKPEQCVKDHLLGHVILNESINYTFCVGNHDYESKVKDYHSLNYLKLLQFVLPNVYVCEPGTCQRVDGFCMVDLPDGDPSQMDEKESNRSPNEPLILAWHGILPNLDFRGNINKQTKTYVSKLLDKWDAQYLALGDIHKQLKITDCCAYPGSLVQKTYECESGIILVEIDEEGEVSTKSLSLDLPKKVVVEIEFGEDDFDSGKNLESEVIKLTKRTVEKGSLVKIKFALPASIWSSLDITAMERKLLRDYAEVKFHNDLVPEKKSRKGLDKIRKAQTIEDELDIIIEEDDSGLDHEKLKKSCLKHLH